MLPKLGVVFRPQCPPLDLYAVTRAAETNRVDELWFWEDCCFHGGLTAATAALAWSRRLHVGIGLLPAPLRNAALVAMEIATLSELFPKRLTVALGHGVQEWMDQVGARVESPLTLLREHATTVTELISGRVRNIDGRYVRMKNVSLRWPPKEPPLILLGARGPRSVALAGEIADGVLLDSIVDADAVRRDSDIVRGARTRSHRGEPEARVAVYAEVAASTDDLPETLAMRAREFHNAGATTVIFHGDAANPDPTRLIEAIGVLNSGGRAP